MDRVLDERKVGETTRERTELRQTELDGLLEDLRDELDTWNLRIEYAIESGDEEKVDPIVAEAVASLDQKWPFHSHEFLISGTWHVNEVRSVPNGIAYNMREQEAFDVKPSNGFAVYRTEPNTYPRVGLSFIYKHLGLQNAALQGNFDILAFADPSKISLSYVRPNANELANIEVASVTEQIEYYDKLLELHYSWGNSEFYRKSDKQQRKFLLDVVDKINDALPSPESGLSILCDFVDIPYVYRHVEDKEGLRLQKLSAKCDDSIMLEGIIHGFTVLEVVNTNTDGPIRTPSQLVEPGAGICMILEVNDGNIPDDYRGQPLFVPIRVADTFNIDVMSTVH